ncbi:DUF5719 family protein [Actinomyces gaoshouyii]|uniref:DUF5719 family protein n=1 Tax=Actinomyces gaoshouyii TaxID=1960083 RepID=UPI0009C1637E|nr:DUF5719 family protein [Actinomyces gaoshouyii]ARD42222.1 prevent-host-death protein [Actinomyces gaoshouyii]
MSPRISLGSSPARRAAGWGAGALLLTGAVALAAWAGPAPAAPIREVGAVDVDTPPGTAAYGCPAAPGNTLGGVDVRQAVTTTTILPIGSPASLSYAGRAVGAATSTPTTLTGSQGSGGGVLTAAPAGAAGAVTSATDAGDLRGLAAAPCAPARPVAWIVGGSTALGSSAELRLTNPGVTTVTARVRLYGSAGAISLPSNGEVVVAAGKTSSLLLESAGAADPRIALSVESDGGSIVPTLVAEGLDGETPAGVEMLTPGAAPATEQTIPAVVMAKAAEQGSEAVNGAESSDEPVLRVVNPGDTTATVAVALSGSAGPSPLPGAQAVTIDPGSVFDITLTGVDPGAYGIRVTSDAPVSAAARMVRVGGELPAGSGALVHDVAWSQAAPPGALASATALMPRDGVSPGLVISSTASEARTVDLASPDGGWSTTVDIPAGSSVTAQVPAGVSAVRLSAAQPDGLSAAVLLTRKASGDAAGPLIAVLPVIADSASQPSTRISLG